jgi:hypothetical protein
MRFLLTNPGHHTFEIPQDVYYATITCVGKQGYQKVSNMPVQPGNVIEYYIESENDNNMSYFGPYLCANSVETVDVGVLGVLGEVGTYGGHGGPLSGAIEIIF